GIRGGGRRAGRRVRSSAEPVAACPKAADPSPRPRDHTRTTCAARAVYSSNSRCKLPIRDGLTFTTRAASGVAPMSSASQIGDLEAVLTLEVDRVNRPRRRHLLDQRRPPARLRVELETNTKPERPECRS